MMHYKTKTVDLCESCNKRVKTMQCKIYGKSERLCEDCIARLAKAYHSEQQHDRRHLQI